MNIVRRYKLSLIKYDILAEKELEDLNIIFNHVKYSKENYELINFIYNNFFNLKQIKLENDPDSLFYFKDDKFIFEQDLLNTTLFFVNYNLIWSVFETKFGYNYEETEQLIKSIAEQTILEQNTNNEWITITEQAIPEPIADEWITIVEETYKLQKINI